MQRPLNANGLPNYERILYVTDGSPSAQAAAGHAVFLAQRSQAQLIVLYIVPNSITRRISFLIRSVMGEERRIAGEAVEAIAKLAAASGVRTTTAMESGNRGDAIDRAASRFDVDLVVVSSPGGEDLQRIFGPPHAGSAPLWEARPICVIMC
jgi:nucleotide-binding universal stress UspA family protein